MTTEPGGGRGAAFLKRLEADPKLAKSLMQGATYTKRLQAALADPAARAWLLKRLLVTESMGFAEEEFELGAGAAVTGALEDRARWEAKNKGKEYPFDEDPLGA